MHRRSLLFMPAAALSAVVLLAACGGSSPTGAPTGAAVAPTLAGATAAAPTLAGATAAPGASVALAQDPALAAKFPATIDGQPVTGVQTGLYLDFMRQYGSSDADIQTATAVFGAIGVDLSQMSFGSAQATVDGEAVNLVALRTPNSDANKLIQNYAAISGALDASPPPPPTMTPTTISGKNATLVVDETGSTDVLYASGDTLFLIEGTTDSQNAKIILALP